MASITNFKNKSKHKRKDVFDRSDKTEKNKDKRKNRFIKEIEAVRINMEIYQNDKSSITSISELTYYEEIFATDYEFVFGIKTKTHSPKETYHLLNNISSTIKEIKTRILEKIQTQSPMGLSYDFLMERHGHYNLCTQPIMQILTEGQYIKKYLTQLTKELLPTHPKDEYVAARKITRHFVIHYGFTNTGKTYNAIKALKEASSGIYLSPLRLLALENYYKMNKEGVPCTLLTGEEEIIEPNAKHYSCTIEKLNLENTYDLAVIDEAQMVADRQRGAAWSRAILGVLAKEVHVCCSPDAVNILKQIIADCNDTVEVREYKRIVPLVMEDSHYQFPESVKKGDALIVFSKRSVLRVAAVLVKSGFKVSVLYGNLPPHTRRKQMEIFSNGESDVVVSTDVIGMGVNLPIKRIVFIETTKFDGVKTRDIEMTEAKQIGGRAGRIGIYDVGYVNTLSSKTMLKEYLEGTLEDIPFIRVSPLESFILSFPLGTLYDRLDAWSNSEYSQPYIVKSDLNEELKLLHSLDMPEYNSLSVEDRYKLIFIPFDSKNDYVKYLWLKYIKLHMEGKKPDKPTAPSYEDLNTLETYYKQLDLYYSFGKTFKIAIDIDWVTEEKIIVADKINKLLLEKMKYMHHKCKRCGKELPWDCMYGLCNTCYDHENSRY